MSFTEPAAGNRESKSPIINGTLIQRCSQIAMLPAAAVKIIGLIDDPDSTPQNLIDVISHDPAVTVRLLKVVNSSYYGMSKQISTIKMAVMLLGINTVKNISIAATLVKYLRGGRISPDFDAGDLWTHSITVATGAMMLAQHAPTVSPDEAFLAGLIHDIGILVEIQAYRADFVRVIHKLNEDEQLTFRMAEEETIGVSHEVIGCAWCKAMNFPRSLQLATGYHHRPLDLEFEDRQLPSLVHIADVLAARIGLGYTRTVETKSVDPRLFDSLLLTEAHCKAMAIALPDAVREVQSRFGG